MGGSASSGEVSEGRLLLLIGAVQFVNILDFMMVMPLGPDFARDLGIATSRLGLVGGAYTAAAAVSGVVAASFLDRFDRRTALIYALLGLVLGTAFGGFAVGLRSLMAARVVAGVFGGPATSLALAIIADVVPVERRGRAMGAVMGAFSVASVLGVPTGLELARLGGWQLPFFAVAGLGLCIIAGVAALLPRMTAHFGQARPTLGATFSMLARPLVLLSLFGTVLAMVGNFALIPNLSAYFQFNRGYPREELGVLYLLGGIVSFGTLRLAGRLTDRVGPAKAAALGSALYVTTLFVGFIRPLAWIPVLALFVTFMVTGTFRFVPMQTLSSRVPSPPERARFMSVQSCVQHLASAVGAMAASQFLEAQANGTLIGMDRVATVTAVTAVLLPVVMTFAEIRVRAKERAAALWSPASSAAPKEAPSTELSS